MSSTVINWQFLCHWPFLHVYIVWQARRYAMPWEDEKIFNPKRFLTDGNRTHDPQLDLVEHTELIVAKYEVSSLLKLCLSEKITLFNDFLTINYWRFNFWRSLLITEMNTSIKFYSKILNADYALAYCHLQRRYSKHSQSKYVK